MKKKEKLEFQEINLGVFLSKRDPSKTKLYKPVLISKDRILYYLNNDETKLLGVKISSVENVWFRKEDGKLLRELLK